MCVSLHIIIVDTASNHNNQQNSEAKTAWADALLAKFPDFDPSWNEDLKLKWFEAFDRLMNGRGI